MKAKEKYIQLCPICASSDFKFYTGNKATEVAGLEQYKCNRCKNIFVFPFETTIKEAKKMKQIKLTKDILSDTPNSAFIPIGNFEVGFYWKVLGLALSIAGIIMLIFSPNWAMALADILAGLYLIYESVFIFESKHTIGRTLRIALVLSLLLVILIAGTPILFYIP